MSLCCIGNIGFCESFVRSIRSAFCCSSDDGCCELSAKVTLAAVTCLGVGCIWHVGVGLSNVCLCEDRDIVLIQREYELNGGYEVREEGGGLLVFKENPIAERIDRFKIAIKIARGGFYTIGNGNPDGYRGDFICSEIYDKIFFKDAGQAAAFIKQEPVVWDCGAERICTNSAYQFSKIGDLFIKWPHSEGYPFGRIVRKREDENFPELLLIGDIKREYVETGSPILKVLITLWDQKLR